MAPVVSYCADVNESAKLSVAGCLVCTTSLMLLTGLAYDVEPLGRLDAKALSWLSAPNDFSATTLATSVMHLADLLPLLMLLAAVCGLALHLGRRRRAVAAVVLVAGANLTTQMLKAVLAHPRYQPILGYYQIGSTSFPSGHATAALSIALALALVAPRPWRPLVALAGIVFAVAIGCSVLILSRHFPSDVLGGWLVAGAWFFAVLASLLSAGEKRSPEQISQSLRSPGPTVVG
jgi:membrane-associated phospholipid phosphatase